MHHLAWFAALMTAVSIGIILGHFALPDRWGWGPICCGLIALLSWGILIGMAIAREDKSTMNDRKGDAI